MKARKIFGLVLSTFGVGVQTALCWISSTNDPGFWGVTNGLVHAVVRSGNVIYLGGDFHQLVSPGSHTVINVNRLAAIDANTGRPTSWRPSADGTVYALAAAPDGSAIYAGGAFTNINGLYRGRFAAISPSGTLLWSAHVTDSQVAVKCFAMSGNTIYMGGNFTRILGKTRLRLAAIQPPAPGGTNATLLSWAPSIRSTDGTTPIVNGVAVANGDVVAVGKWTEANGQPEPNEARFDTSFGFLKPWADHVISATAKALTTDGVNFYAGFAGAGGKVVAWDRHGNLLWVNGANGDVQTITYFQGQILAGGHFTRLQGLDVIRLAAMWRDGTLDTSWNPNPNSGGDRGVWAFHPIPGKLYAGGGFFKMGTRFSRQFAVFTSIDERPAPPTELTATAVKPNQINLDWDASKGDMSATDYVIYRDSQLRATLGAVTSFTDTTVSGGIAYDYVIYAVSAEGEESDPSNLATVTTPNQ